MTIELHARGEAVPVETVDVFTLNGITYGVPKKPPARIALKYLEYVAEHGEEQGVPYLLRLMLGDEGYEALLSHEDLEEHELAAVFTVVCELALGAIEDPKGF